MKMRIPWILSPPEFNVMLNQHSLGYYGKVDLLYNSDYST